MRMLSGSGPTRSRPWLFSTLTLLFLTGCATTRLAEGDQPSKAEALDIGYGTINQDHLVGSVTTVYGVDSPVEHPRTVVEMLALCSRSSPAIGPVSKEMHSRARST